MSFYTNGSTKTRCSISKRVIEANRKRLKHEFTVGQRVLKRRKYRSDGKLLSTYIGPLDIVQVHTNGTVTVSHSTSRRERLSIRRIIPYRE